MKNNIRVRVTKKDIKQGKRGTVSHCPIALAIKRLGYGQVVVCSTVNTTYGNFELTPIANKFIDRFDDGRKVKPFSFTAKKLF